MDDDVPSEPLNKRIVVITGGTGYFGSACVQHFIEHSEYDEIRVVDVAKGRLIDHPRIKFIQTNLLELENCLAVVDGAEVVVHLAGIVDLRYDSLYILLHFQTVFRLLKDLRTDVSLNFKIGKHFVFFDGVGI